MREQLTKYVDLLFAGAPSAEDIKQEILQNTLDRYDDLIAQGKSPEAAYRLAISGIGDINEILGGQPTPAAPREEFPPKKQTFEAKDTPWKKIVRAVAIALYIICPIPLFVLSEFGMDTVGLCGTLVVVGFATALMVIGAKGAARKEPSAAEEYSPQMQLRKSIDSAVTAVTLVVYFILSFATGAWYITWVIFPLAGAVKGLINACIDLKEASQNEN